MKRVSSFCTPEEAPSMLSVVLQEAHEAFIRTDLAGVIVGWTSGAARLYGYSAAETIGSPMSLLAAPNCGQEFGRMLDEVRAGVPVSRGESVAQTKDGRHLPVGLSMVPVTDERRRVAGAVAVACDLTAVQHAEARYRGIDARWRAVVDAAVDGIIVIDSKGIVEVFSAAAEQLFGYRADDVIGRNVSLLMPAPYRDEHDGYMARYIAGGPARIIGIGREVTARRQNGEQFPARLAVGEASVDGQVRFVGIVHDLTDRVRVEARLREQTALAEMSAAVAHEVRNALTGVQGAVQVIGRRLPAGTREAAAAAEVVTRLAGLTAMVDDMLLFAHPWEPKRQPIELRQLAASVVAIIRTDARFQNIDAEVVGAAPAILGDVDLLRTVLLKLLINSAEAMSQGGTINVAIDTLEDTCRIEVTDRGPGVPPEVRDRLFTPFFTTKARGHGLGLAVTKRIIEAHGGTVRAEFPGEGGTRVVLQLPSAAAGRPKPTP
jgi:two-component system sensor kinase FixL